MAGIRDGFSYDRLDDLRIVVSEVCTTAVEATGGAGRMTLSCEDTGNRFRICLRGGPGVFASALGPRPGDETFRVSIVEALVDEAEVSTDGSELVLVLLAGPVG